MIAGFGDATNVKLWEPSLRDQLRLGKCRPAEQEVYLIGEQLPSRVREAENLGHVVWGMQGNPFREARSRAIRSLGLPES